jgi:hypothetical protein
MKHCFILFTLLLCPLIGLSQSTSATISGGVTDTAGRLLVGADVEIANDATGVVYSSKTNSSGMYLVPILPPGHYHVQVSKPGFKTIINADVILNVQSALALNFTLPVGATSESVTVNSDLASLNTTDASVSTVIDRKFVENIPLNGRSFQDLISLTPGVINQSPQSTTTQLIGGSGDFSVNGQRTESNNYTVDGVSANINPGYASGVAQVARRLSARRKPLCRSTDCKNFASKARPTQPSSGDRPEASSHCSHAQGQTLFMEQSLTTFGITSSMLTTGSTIITGRPFPHFVRTISVER